MRVVTGGLLFVLGFAVPFSLLGLLGGSLSATLQSRGWQIALGLLVAALGMFASAPGQSHMFSVFIPLLSVDLGLAARSGYVSAAARF